MRIRYSIPTVLLLIFLGTSCQQTPDAGDLVKYMTVQTEYDVGLINASANIFQTYSNFTMKLDTMGFVSTYYYNDTIRTEDDIPGFVRPITKRVRDNFVNAGFNYVAENENPDFAVNVIILHNFSFSQSVNYGGYYPGYGYYGYYNYYYPVVSTYFSNYVTLVLQVVDIKNYQANNDKYRVIWSGYIGDLNATEDATRTEKTLEAVQTAFDQSPFITAN